MSSPNRTGDTETKVYVGCGSAKQDSPAPARELYTSHYFQKKREYAETVGDSWAILSALCGSLAPTSRTRPYDVTINDYPLDVGEEPRAKYATIDEWADALLDGIENVVHNLERWNDRDPLGRVVMLAGQDYLAPIRDELDALADEHGFEVVYPFDDTTGIGDQIGWLTDEIEAVEDVEIPDASDASSGDTADAEVDLGYTSTGEASATDDSRREQANLAGFIRDQ